MKLVRVGSCVLLAVCGGLFLWNVVSAAATSSILPNGEGANLQFTPSAGATHYTLVDEVVCNGTTDYNRTTTVGQRDSYTVSLASVPDGATVTDIAIKPCASRNNNGGGSATMNVFYRFNGATSSDAGAYALSGTTPVELATTTFSGLSLDKVSTSTAEIGAVYSTGTRGVRLSRISTIITYNSLNAPSGLSGSATTSSSALISWTDNSLNEDGFEIDRSLDGSSWSLVSTGSANTTSYNDTGLSASTTYYYRVRTFNAGVYSSYASTTIVTTIGPNTGIIHYWKLDESSGDATDSVGTSTLTNINATVFGTGKINNGADIEFDNLNTLKTTTNLQGTPFSQYSTCAWLNLESTPAVNDSYVFFTSYDTPGAWDMRYINVDGTPNLKLNHFFNTNDLVAALYPVTLSTSEWSFFCGSWNGSQIQMYLNGSAVGSPVSVGSIRVNIETNGTFIGSQSGLQQWDGLIDEVGVWNRALSSDEISLLYNSGAGRSYPF